MKLMAIDGNSIINRAFYGIRMLNAPDGTPTNGVYGFMAILQKLISDEKPDCLCVCFDLKAPTLRHLRYGDYKAGRKTMPDELALQIPILKETLDAMNVLRFELEGFEADDLIGTVSKLCAERSIECVIVTGDKDSFQLIDEHTRIKYVRTRMGQTETIDYDEKRFEEEYGFPPLRMVDLKALMGDSSDNIPGVSGIGEKTALDLIRRYGTIEAVYAGLDTLDLKDSVRKKLANGRDSAYLSYELAEINRSAPVDIAQICSAREPCYGGELYDIFRRLGFSKFIEKWQLAPEGGDEPEHYAPDEPPRIENCDISRAAAAARGAETVAVIPINGLDELEFFDGENVYCVRRGASPGEYNELLSALFCPSVKKISHDVKALMRLIKNENLPAGGFVFDTELASYLLDPTASAYPIEGLARRYLTAGQRGAAAVYWLYPELLRRMEERGQKSLYFDIEMPLAEVLADMEREGFLVDRNALYEFGEGLISSIDALQADIWRLAGEEFNINSPKQLGVILFEKLMLPAGKKTKTGWSTNVDVLEKLMHKHEIIRQILDYRQLTKLKSTYVDSLLKVIGGDGRIHTSFIMTVTATGRLSSAEPNLQNIPVRTEQGAQVRRMFVAPPGFVLVAADYSQIELRLLAHISGDETMINAFLSGEDIHAVTASQVFGAPLSEVTPLMRSRAKAVNFGIVYGISAFSLAEDIGVFQNEAKAYIDAYLEKYSGVREYMRNVVERAKRDGYVETLFGRRRDLPELGSSNFNIRSFGERVALNMPIQGTAADIMKIAMINTAARLKAEGLEARLILQVHDELIAECPEHEAARVAAILTEEMSGAARLSVPLEAKAKAGKSWAEAK